MTNQVPISVFIKRHVTIRRGLVDPVLLLLSLSIVMETPRAVKDVQYMEGTLYAYFSATSPDDQYNASEGSIFITLSCDKIYESKWDILTGGGEESFRMGLELCW